MRSLFFLDRAAWTNITYTFSWVGVLLVIAGVAMTAYSGYWNATALRAQATIVEIQRDEAGNKHLAINYIDKFGNKHQTTVKPIPLPSSNPNQLSILYHPSDPEKVRIDDFLHKWFGGAFMTLWGALLWWILGTVSRNLRRTREAN